MAFPFKPCQSKAHKIGTFFVGHYYQILQNQPTLSHQFYFNVSTMIRFDGSATDAAVGMEQINELIMCLNFNRIEIKTVHCLDSWSGGIIVMVSGLVQLKDCSAQRKFVQTFFLAPQEKGYFVLNDICNLLEEEPVHQPPEATFKRENSETLLNASHPMPAPVPAPSPSPASSRAPSPAPVSNYVNGEAIQPKELLAPEQKGESEVTDQYSIDEPQEEVLDPDGARNDTPVEEPVALLPSLANSRLDPPLIPVQGPVGAPPKQTYASILRAKGQSGQSVSHPASSKKTTSVAPELHYTPQSAPGQHLQPVLAPEKPSLEVIQETGMIEDEGESLSVYVRNLSPSVTISELKQEFKTFGRIKPDGVAVRSRKDAGVYYAFIEFEDITGVQNALKASPLQLNGRLIHVEERRPNGSLSSDGRRGRGRTSYLSDTSRDYGGRPRVNGYQQRGAR